MPEGFGISDAVKQWAQQKGYGNLEAHLESFIYKARANGYKYANWDAAFMMAIREDWAQLRTGNNRPNPGPRDRWWTTHEGIDRKGRELGLQPGSHETYDEYRQRIFERQRSGSR